MKKILFLTSLLVCMFTLRAQDPETGLYRSYFDADTVVWTCYEEYYDCYLFDYDIVITGDTVVDDTLNCRKLYRYPYHTHYDPHGLVREDRHTGRLWIKFDDYWSYEPWDGWKLIADLSLSVGDSFDGSLVSEAFIDSAGRKTIKINGYTAFVEGVGPFTYIYASPGSPGWTVFVSCVWHNDSLYSSMSWYEEHRYNPDSFPYYAEECSIRVVGINHPTTDNELKIYPNPCTDYITIECKFPVTILDIHGRMVTTINTADKTIDTRALQRGVYFVKVEFDNQAVTRKFIKL